MSEFHLMRVAGAALVALAVLGGGCHRSRPAPAAAEGHPASAPAGADAMEWADPVPVVVTDGAGAAAAVGKRVRLSGTAGNAKLAAVVQVGDDLLVYCLDRPAWPDDLNGQQVTVEGLLEYTEEWKSRVEPSGAISQGTEAGSYVIRESKLVADD